MEKTKQVKKAEEKPKSILFGGLSLPKPLTEAQQKARAAQDLEDMKRHKEYCDRVFERAKGIKIESLIIEKTFKDFSIFNRNPTDKGTSYRIELKDKSLLDINEVVSRLNNLVNHGCIIEPPHY